MVSPEIVQVVAVTGTGLQVPVPGADGEATAWYAVIGEPFGLDAVQLTTICRSPRVTTTFVGAVGGPIGTTAGEGIDG